MLYRFLLFVHLASVVTWVGGMAFALLCLRPAAAALEASQRIALMQRALGKFFPLVNMAIVFILASGIMMIVMSGIRNPPAAWYVMIAAGALMMGIFWHLRAVPFKSFCRLADMQDWAAAGVQLNQVRMMVAVNLGLGFLVIAVMKIAVA